LVGIVVFRGDEHRGDTPPSVSMPSESGVTSSRRNVLDLAAEHASPEWQAPIATTSSGIHALWGSFPKKFFTISCTLGIRVWPADQDHLVDIGRP
jgi:hypothetical protein